jgi:hypothetical protein
MALAQVEAPDAKLLGRWVKESYALFSGEAATKSKSAAKPSKTRNPRAWGKAANS